MAANLPWRDGLERPQDRCGLQAGDRVEGKPGGQVVVQRRDVLAQRGGQQVGRTGGGGDDGELGVAGQLGGHLVQVRGTHGHPEQRGDRDAEQRGVNLYVVEQGAASPELLEPAGDRGGGGGGGRGQGGVAGAAGPREGGGQAGGWGGVGGPG